MFTDQQTIVPDVLRKQRLATVRPQDTVRAASRLMAKRKIGAVLVIKGALLVGIFTERDVLVRVVAAGLDPDRTPLAEVMTPDPDVIGGDSTVRDALDMMHERGYRHLPVLHRKRLTGIVSIRDLYGSVTQQMESDILLLAEGLLHN